MIIVFGSNGLIGSKVIEELIKNDNEKVCCIDISDKKTKKFNTNDNYKFYKIDLLKEKNFLEKIKIDSEKISVINSLYIKNKKYGNKLDKITKNDFNVFLNSNLGMTYEIMRFFYLKLKNKKIKSLNFINIGSIYGSNIPRFKIYDKKMTCPIEYVAYKTALINITKYFVSYADTKNFRANLISPGGMEDNQSLYFKRNYNLNTISKKLLSPESIMSSINFLLSERSRYINGQDLIVDDGFSLK